METIGNNELSREHAAGLFFAIVTVYISHKIKNPRPKAEEPHGLWSPGAKAFLRA